MTTSTRSLHLAAANRAQRAVEAVTEPGGELRAALDDFLDHAVCIALDAASIPEGDRVALDLDGVGPSALSNNVRWAIAEELQQRIFRGLQAPSSPVPA